MEWNCEHGCGPTERDGRAVIVIVKACPVHGHLDLSQPTGGIAGYDLGATGETHEEALIGRLDKIEVAINRLAGALIAGAEVLRSPPPIDAERYETWAHVELFGHRVLVGYVQEDEIAGRRVLGIRRLRCAAGARRVGEPDPPLELDVNWTCYNPAAVYSFHALEDEAAARQRWVALGGGSGSLHFREDDDEIPF